jgi:glycosyltransferase involved in cell wall biosynthesis
VLISDIPENLEVAEDVGVIFKSRDVEDLRRKLEHLIRHPEEVRRFESLARKHVYLNYSWDKVAENTEIVYRDLLARRR